MVLSNLRLVTVAALLSYSLPVHAQLPSANASTALDCGSNLTIDRKTNRFSCEQGIRITQGNLTLKANSGQSNSLDLANSTLTFTDNVRIEGPNTEVTADRATLKFVNKRLLSVSVVGQPARFEQSTGKEPNPAKGHANIMDYNVSDDIITLRENAFLSQGLDQISGEVITYHIEEERVIADSNGDTENRVRLIINPNTDEPEDSDQP